MSSLWKDHWEEQRTLEGGTLLYHGTSQSFDGEKIRLPAWFSNSEEVGRWFARRGNVEDSNSEKGFVLQFRVESDLVLPSFKASEDRERFSETFDLEFWRDGKIRESAERSELPGWIVPSLYPDHGGDNILLCDSVGLSFEGREVVRVRKKTT